MLAITSVFRNFSIFLSSGSVGAAMRGDCWRAGGKLARVWKERFALMVVKQITMVARSVCRRRCEKMRLS